MNDMLPGGEPPWNLRRVLLWGIGAFLIIVILSVVAIVATVQQGG